MAPTPSIPMESASKQKKVSKESSGAVDMDIDVQGSPLVSFEKNFCSGEGCFIDRRIMIENINKLTDNMIESITPLSVHPDYSTRSDTNVSLDTIKNMFQNNEIGAKIFYTKPNNLNIITELYNAIGQDINTMTTYMVYNIENAPLCYGIKINMKQPYKILLTNHKNIDFFISNLYLIFQYPCQSDIFKIVKDAYTPSAIQLQSKSLQRNFIKYAPKLFHDLIYFHKNNFILYDIKLENIVYCSKTIDDYRHIDFSYGAILYDNWIKGIPEKVFRTYSIEPAENIFSIQEYILQHLNLYTNRENLLKANFELFKTILKLNDVFVLLYSWSLSSNYVETKKFKTDKIIDLSLLGHIRIAFMLDRSKNKFILDYVYQLNKDLERLLPLVKGTFQDINSDMDFTTSLDGLINNINYYLSGLVPGGGGKQTKIDQFIKQYKDTYFISEKVNQQPYLKIIYVYRINDIVSSKNRTLSVSRYKLDLVKNPSMSLKNLKGKKEEAKLITGSILKLNQDRLIPLK